MASDLNAAIARIYESSIESDGLDRLAETVAEALGSSSGLLSLLDRPAPGQDSLPSVVGLPSATANFDDWARSAYAEHYHHCNIWFERGVKRGFPAIVLSHELVAPEELLKSEWYDYCQRLDTFHVLGAQFHVTDTLSAQFGAQRPRRSRPFDESSRRRMSLLLPHLQRALQIKMRLGVCDQFQAVTLDLLERAGIAVFLLDESRRLLFANRLAEQILERRSGLRLVGGRVSLDAGSAAAFDHLIRETALTSGGRGLHSGGTLNLLGGDGTATRLFISPLARDHVPCGSRSPAVLMLASDAASVPWPAADSLRDAFDLTRAEAQLLAAVVGGQDLPGYADSHGVSIETARTHLKRVLNKTGYHRQLDLVRALASDVLLRLDCGATDHSDGHLH